MGSERAPLPVLPEPDEKVAILRRHLLDKVPVSERCEELGLAAISDSREVDKFRFADKPEGGQTSQYKRVIYLMRI